MDNIYSILKGLNCIKAIYMLYYYRNIFDMYVLFLLTHNRKLYNVEGKEHHVVLRPESSPTEYIYSEVPL